MIGNLNQLSFVRYGHVQSERRNAADVAGKPDRYSVHTLQKEQIPVYVSAGEIWLRSREGMTVLSVAVEGETFQHFYLDKTVCVRPGVRFAVSVFYGASTAEVWGGECRQVDTIDSIRRLTLQRRLSVSKIYTFFYQEKEKGFVFPGTAHKPLELTYVDKGSIHSVADGKDILLNQGDLIIYDSDQWHMQYADVDVAASFLTISFQMDGECPAGLVNRKFTVPQHGLTLLQWMLRERDQMDEYSGDVIISQLQGMLLLLLRDANNAGGGKLRAVNAVNSENEIIRRAQQYISENVRRKLTVPLVAERVEVSSSYLTALFRKNLQISPGEYIRRVKLQESKKMIREDNMNFTEIAAALQYSTVHHFSRQFKEKFGITPTEYAKSVR